jgi:hypothetical protein
MRICTLLICWMFFIAQGYAYAEIDNQAVSLPKIPGAQFHLGKVNFPISTASPLAKAHFYLGLKYLHNFMYPFALREFKLAALADPKCAICYWGMAMCYKWPLWVYENKEKGREILNTLKTIKDAHASPLEQGLIDALASIYEPGTLLDNEKKYAQAMRQLHQNYPNNPDVSSFYALSLIGYAGNAPQDKDAPIMMDEARLILQQQLKLNPTHPGLIHYFVHANDVPNKDYPKKALSMVNYIYTNLGDSAHVLHMPSHLYTILGDWQQAAHSNQLSVEAARRVCRFLDKEHIDLKPVNTIDVMQYSPDVKIKPWSQKQLYACDADNIYHSLEWIHYAYLQLNQFKRANQALDEMKKVADVEQDAMYTMWYYRMKARQMLYSNELPPMKAMPEPLMEHTTDKIWAAYSECGMLLADGFSAIKHQQVQFLPLIEARYTFIIQHLSSASASAMKQACILNQKEFQAVNALRINHDVTSATKLMDEALKIQDFLQSLTQTLTLPFIPAQELYVSLLLQNKDKASMNKAIELYHNELLYYQNRPQAVEGLKRMTRIR